MNRAWRVLLRDPSLWERTDASATSGVARFSFPMLLAAVAKAGGQLRALDYSGQRLDKFQPRNRLIEAVRANTATLTELRFDNTGQFWVESEVRALLKGAPSLKMLELRVSIGRDAQVARAMLRNEPPFQALRSRGLRMYRGFDTPADVVLFCSDVRCHASLEELRLHDAALSTAVSTGAVVDACIALGVRILHLMECGFVPAALPELTRLIAAGALRELFMLQYGVRLFEHHGATLRFVAALRASAMTRLRIVGNGFVPKNIVDAEAFINARSQ